MKFPIVKIQDNQNRGHRCRILLDSGSQSNFITKELTSKLKLELHPANIPVIGINKVKSQVGHYVNAKRYVVTADIAKMYRQILVDKSQTKLQRILWRFDPSDVIEECELLTVTYGTASASYLAIKAMLSKNVSF
ncbi:putative peptidase (DUF1758) [Popillia japonica]|uniref:Peptidase (DUF1758) n=1 Tax=Popillia japonica TaxID=7064 RepID=A0AAW1NBD4_POPJA